MLGALMVWTRSAENKRVMSQVVHCCKGGGRVTCLHSLRDRPLSLSMAATRYHRLGATTTRVRSMCTRARLARRYGLEQLRLHLRLHLLHLQHLHLLHLAPRKRLKAKWPPHRLVANN